MTLSEEEKTQVMLGAWSVREIVVHIAAWLRVSTGAMERMASGEGPVPEGVDYSDGDAWNARFVEESKGKSVGQVEAELHAAKEALVQAIRALPEERLAEGKTARRMIEEIKTSDFRQHGGQILEWKTRTAAGRPIPPGVAREAAG